ncbi:hypothetical protein [Corynebacterium endometrii]|uniref:hypothetical protein n=1 Tax=Corynebacterium endometrii TaxID=2488819 RepID=UPI001FE864D3|nr:hypothetical protein [Corynebacterium endometrii]
MVRDPEGVLGPREQSAITLGGQAGRRALASQKKVLLVVQSRCTIFGLGVRMMVAMMGQELFEHPLRQYKHYGISALKELTDVLGEPEQFEDSEPTPQQQEAIERAFESQPDGALAYDESTGLWILGDGDDINRMFADREEFVEALENGLDPEA